MAGIDMIGAIVPIGIGGTLLMFFWIWAVFDVIATDSILIRNLSKGTWLFLVLIVPTVGALAWLLLGRPEGASVAPGGQSPAATERTSRGRPGPRGLEDSPAWPTSSGPSLPSALAGTSQESLAVRQRKLMEKEADLINREEALEAREAALAEREAALEAQWSASAGGGALSFEPPADRASPSDGDPDR
jgi:hypothetical protein